MAITKSNKGYSTGVSAAGMGQSNNSNGPFGVSVTHGPQPLDPVLGDLWADNAGDMYIYTQQGWVATTTGINSSINASIKPISAGQLSVGNAQTYAVHQPTSVISIETKLGRVSVDIETGDLTIPQGVGRDTAIREFWLGFQEYFKPANTVKYEKEIEDLKREVANTKSSAALMKQASEKEANKRVAEKIRKKYNGEKFIMVKPEDLVRFIEEN